MSLCTSPGCCNNGGGGGPCPECLVEPLTLISCCELAGMESPITCPPACQRLVISTSFACVDPEPPHGSEVLTYTACLTRSGNTFSGVGEDASEWTVDVDGEADCAEEINDLITSISVETPDGTITWTYQDEPGCTGYTVVATGFEECEEFCPSLVIDTYSVARNWADSPPATVTVSLADWGGGSCAACCAGINGSYNVPFAGSSTLDDCDVVADWTFAGTFTPTIVGCLSASLFIQLTITRLASGCGAALTLRVNFRYTCFADGPMLVAGWCSIYLTAETCTPCDEPIDLAAVDWVYDPDEQTPGDPENPSATCTCDIPDFLDGGPGAAGIGGEIPV